MAAHTIDTSQVQPRKSELQLDDAERMLGLGTDAGLELLQFIDQPLARTALVQCLALARVNRPGF